MMVIRRVFRRRASRIHSLISLTILAAMLAVFFLLMPEFTSTLGGKAFVVVWGLLALLSFGAYGRSSRVREGRQYIPLYGIQKNERASKKARSTSFMGGS